MPPWTRLNLDLDLLMKRGTLPETQADAEHRPMYLESSSQANNAYYEQFGFEVKRDIFLERGSVPVRLSAMVREPRAPGSKKPKPMVKKFGSAKGLMG